MKGRLEKAFGYQDDHMNLPVADVDAAVGFYEAKLGFRLTARGTEPQKWAVLSRDAVEMRLVENGGDSSQDGCAFHVIGIDALLEEFQRNGLQKGASDFSQETHDGITWRVFYVAAPDGLCYWFGERQ